MGLKQITIKNYRSIENWTLTFSDNKTVLVWKNNAWKTNFLSVLEIFFSGKYPTYWNFSESDFFNIEKDIVLNVEFEWIDKIWLIVSWNWIKCDTKWDWTYRKNKDLARICSFVYIPSNRSIDQHLRNNTYWRYWKLLQKILEYKNTSPEYATLISKLDEIEDLFSKLLPTEDISRISKTLTYINTVSFWMSWWSNPDDLLKKVDIFVDDGVWNMPLSSFWTWTQSTVILWLLELYLKVSKHVNKSESVIFVIDEPENFLHPHAKRLLDNVLHSISRTTNTQVVYSTHSSELITNFDSSDFKISDVRIIYKDWTRTKVKKIPKFDNLAHELNSYNSEVFFADYIVLVEWNTERIMFPWICYNYARELNHLPKDLQDIYGRYSIEDQNNEICKFFDLNLHNVSVITVDGKDSLPKRYEFCSHIVWKENTFVLMDKDIHLTTWQLNVNIISNVIKKVNSLENLIIENEFSQYNRFVLNWEFEYQYKKEIIKNILIWKISPPSWLPEEKIEYFLTQKQKEISDNVDKIYTEAISSKFSKWFEKLIKSFYQWFSKPAISKQIWKEIIYKDWIWDNLLGIIKKIMFNVNWFSTNIESNEN